MPSQSPELDAPNIKALVSGFTKSAVGGFLDKRAVPDLLDALKPRESHCAASRRNKLSDWWFDYGPRTPAWDLHVVAWDQYSNPEANNYTLFTLWQLGWFKARKARKLMQHTDRPIVLKWEYSWA